MVNNKQKSNISSDTIFLDKQYGYFINYINKGTGIVYHYTSLDTMSKILTNSTLRFSNINFQNDECEFTYFYLLLEEHLKEYKWNYDTAFCKYLDNICAEYCASPFYYFGPDIQRNINRQYYISSFSITDDNLALWTLYTKEKGFIGCNFGINPKQVSIYTDNDLLTSGMVIYDREEQENILKEILSMIFYKYQKNFEPENFLEKVAKTLNKYALFFKHPAFEQEKEYRFVYKPTENFNIQNFENKPFIDLPLNVMTDIKCIRLSPTLRDSFYINEIKKLFKKHKIITNKFDISKIPFSNSYKIDEGYN